MYVNLLHVYLHVYLPALAYHSIAPIATQMNIGTVDLRPSTMDLSHQQREFSALLLRTCKYHLFKVAHTSMIFLKIAQIFDLNCALGLPGLENGLAFKGYLTKC